MGGGDGRAAGAELALCPVLCFDEGMFRTLIAIAAALLVTGCQSADARFEKSFGLASGEPERCRVATEAVDHFLRAGDEAKLEKWRSKAAFPCLASRAGRF